MKNPHWLYFIALEKELIESIPYVEIGDGNEKAFSTEYGKILFAACSEIDVLGKLICKRVISSSKADNIDEYSDEILVVYSKICSVEISVPRYEILLKPWNGWSRGNSPAWWTAYNKVKHERNMHYKKGNQENAIASLAGLFVLLMYYYYTEIRTGNFYPAPELFNYDGMYPDTVVCEGTFLLPDKI